MCNKKVPVSQKAANPSDPHDVLDFKFPNQHHKQTPECPTGAESHENLTLLLEEILQYLIGTCMYLWFIPPITGFSTFQVVQDLLHQQYVQSQDSVGSPAHSVATSPMQTSWEWSKHHKESKSIDPDPPFGCQISAPRSQALGGFRYI